MTAARLTRVAVIMAAIALLPLNGMAQRGDAGGPVASLRADTRYFTVGSHFFAPADITVEAGELVGGRTAVIEPGQRVEFDWTPPAPGLYRIVCAVCPAEEEMLALVHVR